MGDIPKEKSKCGDNVDQRDGTTEEAASAESQTPESNRHTASKQDELDDDGDERGQEKRYAVTEESTNEEGGLKRPKIKILHKGQPVGVSSEDSSSLYDWYDSVKHLPIKKREYQVDNEPIHPALQMDQAEWRRRLPRSCICVTKTLTLPEVNPYSSVLELDVFDAAALTNCPELVDGVQGSSLHKELVVFDNENIKYQMLLMNYIKTIRKRRSIAYCINKDWARFVRLNCLKEGDEINIFRTSDPRVHNEPYFVIKFFRKPLPRPKPKPNSSGAEDSGSTTKVRKSSGDDKDNNGHKIRRTYLRTMKGEIDEV